MNKRNSHLILSSHLTHLSLSLSVYTCGRGRLISRDFPGLCEVWSAETSTWWSFLTFELPPRTRLPWGLYFHRRGLGRALLNWNPQVWEIVAHDNQLLTPDSTLRTEYWVCHPGMWQGEFPLRETGFAWLSWVPLLFMRCVLGSLMVSVVVVVFNWSVINRQRYISFRCTAWFNTLSIIQCSSML